jgi:acetyl esterase
VKVPVAAPRFETIDDLVESRPFWEAVADLENLPAGVDVHENVVLGGRSGGKRVLTAEIYAPRTSPPHPLALWIHGGGWYSGSPRTHRKAGMELAAAGFLVLAPDYALCPEWPFPHGISDCLHAVRWFARHAADWGGDPARLVLCGNSSGGTGAAALTTLLNGFSFDLDDEYADVPVQPIGQVLISPVLARAPIGSAGRTVGPPREERSPARVAYLGERFAELLEHPLVSPIFSPNKDRWPPTYVVCGTDDPLAGPALRLVEDLRALRVPVTALFVGGADHSWWHNRAAAPEWRSAAEHMRTWAIQLARAAAERPPAQIGDAETAARCLP